MKTIHSVKRKLGGKRTRWLIGAAAVAMSAAVVTTGPVVLAADGPFTIDGAVPDAGAVELSDQSGNVKELGPLNSNTTKIGVIHNDAVPTLGLTNPNGQVDLRRAFLDLEKDAGHDWLYFGWERDSSNGSGFITIEMLKNPPPAACAYGTASQESLIASCNPWANRAAGDFMIFWDQQGGSRDLYLRTWTGTAPNLTLSAPTLLNAAVSQAQYSADGFSGEAAIDLTATVFGGNPASCLAFANTIPSTVTGNSDTADYKDTILTPAPNISNCQSTTVTTPKDGNGDDIPADGVSIGTGVVAVKDSAVVNLTGGAGTPAGSVAFSLCKVDSPGLCATGGTAVGSAVNLAPAPAYPVTVVSPTAYVTSAGRYCWRADFSGDSNSGIPASSDSSATECFTVNPVTPTLATTAGDDVLLGNPVTDTATLTNTATQPAVPVINTDGAAGAAAAGTVTFTLLKADCSTPATGTGTNPQTVDLANGSAGPVSFQPDAPGTYHWIASYTPAAGDANNQPTGHNSSCDDDKESVIVNTVKSTLSTAQTWVPNDSATVSAPAGGNLAGTVTFTLFPSLDCTGTAVFAPAQVGVAGASPQTVSTSNTTAISATGNFSWQVSYDSTNPAQEDIPNSCEETSALTIDNGDPVSSP